MADTKFESLPDDVLFDVVSLLSVPDILRLRQVSRKFHCLTRERTVWVNAYRKSTILRPPGPFPSQSAAYLEQELKKSIKLHTKFTSPNPKHVSIRSLKLRRGMYTTSMVLVLGRYLLVPGRELRCYDLNLQDTFYGDIADRPIASYTTRFGVHYKIVVDTIEHEHRHEPQLSIKCALIVQSNAVKFVYRTAIITLLDLHFSHGTARFEQKNQVRVPIDSHYVVGTLAGNFLLIDDHNKPKVLHVHTLQLYHLPPCDFRSPGAERSIFAFTPTHLLVQSNDQNVLEAFLLPDGVPESGQMGTRQQAVLTRSHIAFHRISIAKMDLISWHTTHANTFSGEDQDSRSGSSSYDTISMTFLSLIGREWYPEAIGFVDIVLKNPAVGEESMTVSLDEGTQKFNVEWITCGTVQRGCARILSFGGLDGCPLYTVNAGEGDRSIVSTSLQHAATEWDGMSGRMCTNSSSYSIMSESLIYLA